MPTDDEMKERTEFESWWRQQRPQHVWYRTTYYDSGLTVWLARATLALSETEALQKELKELQSTFDLQWKANQRGIKAWQAANPGNDLVWPDQAKLVQWLIERAESAEREVRQLKSDMVDMDNDTLVQRERAEKAEQQREEWKAKFREADERHVRFMVAGGPVVMSSEYDKVVVELAVALARVKELEQPQRFPYFGYNSGRE